MEDKTMSTIYNSYRRLKNLLYFEFETSFEMDCKLDSLHLLSVDLDPYKKTHGKPKLYDKNVRIYRYIFGHGNQLIFETKDFDVLKKWLKSNNFI